MAGEDSPVADAVRDLLSPVIATTGAELLDVEWVGGTLRLVIDEPGGVTTKTLASVNRLVSPVLDQHDPVPGRYTLEVSSPGIERPLRRVEHFRRAMGEQITVKLIPSVEPRRVQGLLAAVEQDQITVEAKEINGVPLDEEENQVIRLDDIAKAKTVFEWGPTPRKGGKGKGKKKKSKASKSKQQADSADDAKAAVGSHPNIDGNGDTDG